MRRYAFKSIDDRMAETGGRPSGFDYLRLCLALAVITRHAAPISGSHLWAGLPGIVMVIWVMSMFLALSGFLVAASLEQCRTLISFCGLRFLRIVPALAVEIILSALMLGPLLTAFDLSVYFSSAGFYHYFLNVIGYIHYTLPGVFLQNPYRLIVNGQLWTIPLELECYFAICGGIAITGLMRRRRVLVALVLIDQAFWLWRAFRSDQIEPTPIIILSFLTGVLLYLFRKEIPYDRRIAAITGLICIALLFVSQGIALTAWPMTYLTIYLGLLNPRRNRLLRSGDYSYGLYLYGFPIQQTFASLGSWAHNWFLNAIVCIPVTLSVAFLSWHLVEKRAHGLRRYLPVLEERLLQLVRGRPPTSSVVPTEATGTTLRRRWPRRARRSDANARASAQTALAPPPQNS